MARYLVSVGVVVLGNVHSGAEMEAFDLEALLVARYSNPKEFAKVPGLGSSCRWTATSARLRVRR